MTNFSRHNEKGREKKIWRKSQRGTEDRVRRSSISLTGAARLNGRERGREGEEEGKKVKMEKEEEEQGEFQGRRKVWILRCPSSGAE